MIYEEDPSLGGELMGLVLTHCALPYVHQHVGIGTMLHREILIMTTKVVVNGFLFGTPGHHIIIKLAPLKSKQKHIAITLAQQQMG